MLRHLLEDISGCTGETKTRMLTTLSVRSLLACLGMIAAILTSLAVVVHFTSVLPLRFQKTDARLAAIEDKLTDAHALMTDYLRSEDVRREQLAGFESKITEEIAALRDGQVKIVSDAREREERMGRLVRENWGGIPLQPNNGKR